MRNDPEVLKAIAIACGATTYAVNDAGPERVIFTLAALDKYTQSLWQMMASAHDPEPPAAAPVAVAGALSVADEMKGDTILETAMSLFGARLAAHDEMTAPFRSQQVRAGGQSCVVDSAGRIAVIGTDGTGHEFISKEAGAAVAAFLTAEFGKSPVFTMGIAPGVQESLEKKPEALDNPGSI